MKLHEARENCIMMTIVTQCSPPIYYNDEIKEDQMGGVRSTYGTDKMGIQLFGPKHDWDSSREKGK
jgi:hypothetical protein